MRAKPFNLYTVRTESRLPGALADVPLATTHRASWALCAGPACVLLPPGSAVPGVLLFRLSDHKKERFKRRIVEKERQPYRVGATGDNRQF